AREEVGTVLGGTLCEGGRDGRQHEQRRHQQSTRKASGEPNERHGRHGQEEKDGVRTARLIRRSRLNGASSRGFSPLFSFRLFDRWSLPGGNRIGRRYVGGNGIGTGRRRLGGKARYAAYRPEIRGILHAFEVRGHHVWPIEDAPGTRGVGRVRLGTRFVDNALIGSVNRLLLGDHPAQRPAQVSIGTCVG